MKKVSGLGDACEHVVRHMKGVMTRDEVVAAVTRLYQSKAKKPGSSVMTTFRNTPGVVSLGNARYSRIDHVSEGAKFRILVDGVFLTLGMMKPILFYPFDKFWPPLESRFLESDGSLIPIVSGTVHLDRLDDAQFINQIEYMANMSSYDIDSAMESVGKAAGIGAWDDAGFDDEDEDIDLDELKHQIVDNFRAKIKAEGEPRVEGHFFTEFFKKHKVREGDSLIVTLHAAENCYVFEHEPADQARHDLIEQRDAELRGIFHDAIKNRDRESIADLVFRAYGNLGWMKEYPSYHWFEIVENDDELRMLKIFSDNWMIAPIDYSIPLEMAFGTDPSTARKRAKRYQPLIEKAQSLAPKIEKSLKELTQSFDKVDFGGKANVVGRSRPPRDEDQIYNLSEKLISRFVKSQKSGEGAESVKKKRESLEWLAEFLLVEKQIALSYAEMEDLESFFLDWLPQEYPELKVERVEQIMSHLREFYLFLVSEQMIRSAKFAESLYGIRHLVGETYEFISELPAEIWGELPFVR